MKRPTRRGGGKQCKCAPQQIMYKALFLVAFNPLGLSGRLQPHSPGRGNDRHYYPAQNSGAVRGGWGRCCLASSKIWELNFHGEIEDTKEDQVACTGAPRTPSSTPSWPARPSPSTHALGPDQECGSRLSPQATRKVGYTTPLAAKSFLLSNLSSAFGLSPFPLAGRGTGGQLVASPQQESPSSPLLQPESSQLL